MPTEFSPVHPNQPATVREFKDLIPPPVLIRADGTRQAYQPADGQRFTLDELQAAVGGDIEPIYLGDELVMLVNELGKLMRLPCNDLATWLAQPGLYIFADDWISGDALVLPLHLLD